MRCCGRAQLGGRGGAGEARRGGAGARGGRAGRGGEERGEAEAGGWGRGEAGLGARRGVHRLKLYPGIQPIAFVFVVAGSLFLDLASFLQWSEDMPGMSVACARSCIRVRVCQNL